MDGAPAGHATGCSSDTQVLDISKLFEGLYDCAAPEGRVLTTEELREITGKGAHWIRAKIKIAIQKGIARPCKKTIIAMDGRVVGVSAYRFL